MLTEALLVLPSFATGLLPQDPIPDPNAPPFEGMLSGSQKSAVLLDVGNSAVEGVARYSMLQKTVEINWIYSVAGLSDGPLYDPTKGQSIDKLALDFWPTEVVSLGLNRFAVAGATARGKTVIKVFALGDFVLPSVVYPVGGGKRKIPKLDVPVTLRNTVYETDTGDGRYVSAMFRNRGQSGSLFVQFHDTKEIHELDVATGALTKVVTTPDSGDTSVLIAPQLEYQYLAVNDGEHNSLGHLYWFFSPGGISQQGAVMLVDEDKDGDLDRAEVISNWSSTYSDLDNFASVR